MFEICYCCLGARLREHEEGVAVATRSSKERHEGEREYQLLKKKTNSSVSHFRWDERGKGFVFYFFIIVRPRVGL